MGRHGSQGDKRACEAGGGSGRKLVMWPKMAKFEEVGMAGSVQLDRGIFSPDQRIVLGDEWRQERVRQLK